MLKMICAPAAASRGVDATVAPAAASGAALSLLRLNTARGNLAESRREAMPAPMMPRPRSAMRGFVAVSLIGVWSGPKFVLNSPRGRDFRARGQNLRLPLA